jgi:hypothetical protein
VLNLVLRLRRQRHAAVDLKDLRAMLQYVGDNAKEFTTLRQRQRQRAPFSGACCNWKARALTSFGEPMLDINDFMQTVDAASTTS